MKDTIYCVFRIYSAKERPDDYNSRSVLYGWSTSKNVVDALLSQRSKKKYKAVKLTSDDRKRLNFYPEIENKELMIDFVKLKSVKTHDEIKFFTTLYECQQAEFKIQEYFHDLCSLKNENQVRLFLKLDRYYLDALEFIGFRPKEVDAIYDSMDYKDNYNTLKLAEDEIEDVYSGLLDSPPEDGAERYHDVPGILGLSQIHDKILYSLESFISVLKDDL